MSIEIHPDSKPYIPEKAYLFFPKKYGIGCQDTQRSIFDGNTEFTSDERDKIDKFRAYAQEHHYALKPMWTDNMILRFLYAMGFKRAKALQAIKDHTVWRETFLPVQVDDQLRNFLNSGLLYVHGRDSQLRPIMVFNVNMIDPKKTDTDLVIRTMTFWLEYIINEWMLPGQVENWVFLVNLKGVSGAVMALSSLKKMFAYLADNYKCRLANLYMLNVTNSIYVPWQIVKKFLDDVTVQKIQFYKTQVPTALFETTNKAQVEEKFGGTAPNCTQYWPPVIPSDQYCAKPQKCAAIISKEEYKSRYRSGILTNMYVNQSFIDEVLDTRNLTVTKTPSKRSLSASSLYDLVQSTASSANEAKTESLDNLTTSNPTSSNPTTLDSLDSYPSPMSQLLREDSIDNRIDFTSCLDETVGLTKQRSAVREFQANFMSASAPHKHWHS